MRQRGYEAICRERQEQDDTAEAFEAQNLREYEAEQRTLDGIAYQLDLGFTIGQNDRLASTIYETLMRVPDEVRTFVCETVVFLSAAWGGVPWGQLVGEVADPARPKYRRPMPWALSRIKSPMPGGSTGAARPAIPRRRRPRPVR